MTFIIDKDEATQARRRVPFKVFASNGTSPETGFSDATVLHTVNGGAQVVSNNSASAVSANAGMYYIEFDAAEIATLGNYAIYTDSVGADFEQHVANFQVVNFNPMSSQSNMAGNVASVFTVGVTSTATIAGTTNTATLINALNDIDGSGVTLHAGTHSSATIPGVTRVESTVTVADADYSAVTVRAHSSSTIAGVTNVATQITALNDIDGSAVTLHAGVHSGATVAINDATGDVSSRFTVAVESGATIAGVTNTATLIGALNDIDGSAVTLHAGVHSGATVAINDATGNVSSKFTVGVNSGATIAGVTNTATLINALNDIDGSAVTLHAGTHSGVTVQGVTRVDSNVTIANAAYSAVSVRLDPIEYSALTVRAENAQVGAGGIASTAFAASAIDAAALATDAGQEIADRVLVRNIEGGNDSGRTVGEALAALRNRVVFSATSYVVYRNDDNTVWWHASLSTTDSTVFPTGYDPDV